MKSDFERLLDSIGVLETERQHLEAELEKSKLTQASQQASSANGQYPQYTLCTSSIHPQYTPYTPPSYVF